jgi:hypothetical protein
MVRCAVETAEVLPSMHEQGAPCSVVCEPSPQAAAQVVLHTVLNDCIVIAGQWRGVHQEKASSGHHPAVSAQQQRRM